MSWASSSRSRDSRPPRSSPTQLRSAIMYGVVRARGPARRGRARRPARGEPRPAARGHAAARPGGPATQRTPPRACSSSTSTPRTSRDVYLARLAIERAACQLIMHGNRGEAVVRLAEALDALVTAAESARPHRDERRRPGVPPGAGRCSGNPRLERMAQTLLVETRMCLAALQEHYPEPHDLVDRAPQARRRDLRRRRGAAAAPDRGAHERLDRPAEHAGHRRSSRRSNRIARTGYPTGRFHSLYLAGGSKIVCPGTATR